MSCPAHAGLALAIGRAFGSPPVSLDSELTPGDAHELETVRALCAAFAPGPELLLGDVLRAHETAGAILHRLTRTNLN